MSKAQAPNWQEAREFLELITGERDPVVCFQVFDDRGEDSELAAWRHGRLSDPKIRKWLLASAAQGCGVFFAVNRMTPGKKRRNEFAKVFQCVAVDFDKTALPDAWGLDPTVINETSPGRHHVFWKVQPGVNMALWKDTQTRLAKYYGGDPSVNKLAGVLRLPGFFHQKAKPFRVRTIKTNAVSAFDTPLIDDIRAAHLCEYDPPGKSDVTTNDFEGPDEWDKPADVEAARAKLAKAKKPKTGDRNNAAFRMAAICNDHAISPETTLELLHEWNESLDDPLPEHELRHVTRSAPEYKQSAPGSKSVVNAEDDFADAPEPDSKLPCEEWPPVAKKKASGLATINAAEIKPEAIDYIWNNRLAKGMHTAIAGIGGLGKSQLVYSLIAKITNGGPWPDREGNAPKGRCIILSAEEGKKDMIVPRLIAAGADLKLVEIVDCVRENDGTVRKFNLQKDLDKLKKRCRELGDVVLISIDPVSSYLGGDIDTHRNTAVRTVLDPISDAAEDIGCAILSVTHFNKNTNAKAIDRVMESAAFVNAPRATFCVLNHAADPAKRLFLMLKTNMGKEPPGLSYHVEEAYGGFDEKKKVKIKAPKIVWDGIVDITADEATDALNDKGGAPKLQEAMDMLNAELADGPQPVADIKVLAITMDIAEVTLKRARSALGIKAFAVKGVMPPKWVYALPSVQCGSSESTPFG